MAGMIRRGAGTVMGVLAGMGSIASAQTFVTYDASAGMPAGQCWVVREDLNPVAPYTLELVGSDLRISTTALATTGDTGGGVWVQHSDVEVDFGQPWALEARVRIASAPDHSVNPQTGWPRPGYALAVYDVVGRIYWVGLGMGEVFLSNSAFGQYGSANTVTTAVNTADAHHTYRLERSSGTGVTLLIDGVARLSLSAAGGVEGSVAQVYFGDPTYWANSDSFTSWIRYTGSGPTRCCDSIDFNGDGLFPDTQDISDFIAVFGGGACPTGSCGDIDFNNDGLFPDTADIDALLSVFSGGACV